MLEAFAAAPECLPHAAALLFEDDDFLLRAVTCNPCALGLASHDVRSDPEFMLQAIEVNPAVFQYSTFELRQDRDFLFKAACQTPAVLQHVDDQCSLDDGLLLDIIAVRAEAVSCMPDGRRADKDGAVQEGRLLPRSLHRAWDSQLC